MKKDDKIPYPSEVEIQKQITLIVHQALPAKKSILNEIKEIYKQIGLYNVLPNRTEFFYAGLFLSAILLFIWLSTGMQEKITPSYLAFLFMLSPFLFLTTAFFSFYEKKEQQTFEVEMTTKYTIFQLICLRMLLFSGITIIANTTIALWLAHLLQMDFLRMWLLSLTGLFLFGIGLFKALRKGQVIRNLIAYVALWVGCNSCLLFFANTLYIQTIAQLPIIVYVCLVAILIGFFIKAFENTYLRKQEGVWIC